MGAGFKEINKNWDGYGDIIGKCFFNGFLLGVYILGGSIFLGLCACICTFDESSCNSIIGGGFTLSIISLVGGFIIGIIWAISVKAEKISDERARKERAEKERLEREERERLERERQQAQKEQAQREADRRHRESNATSYNRSLKESNDHVFKNVSKGDQMIFTSQYVSDSLQREWWLGINQVGIQLENLYLEKELNKKGMSEVNK